MGHIDNVPLVMTSFSFLSARVKHDATAKFIRAFSAQCAKCALGRRPRDRIAVAFADVCTPTFSQTLGHSPGTSLQHVGTLVPSPALADRMAVAPTGAGTEE